MNLNDEAEDSFFNQHCLELAKSLRAEQTEHFLHLYDSLPTEWNGAREYLQLDAAKERIRQLQELDEQEFEIRYQRAHPPSSTMSNLPQSALIRNSDNANDPSAIPTTSRITSLPLLQQKQHHERITANNLACDETHEFSSKHSSSTKRITEEFNTKTRRLQPITNNSTHDTVQDTCRTRTAVDSFVQLNLKPAIDIKLEDYKKARDPMSATKTSNTNQRSSNEPSPQTTLSSNLVKKSKTASIDQFHADASFDYCTANTDNATRQRSRSSSSSSSTHQKTDLSITDTLSPSHAFGHTTKSSSENSGSARTGSDSDDEHHHQPGKNSISPSIKFSLDKPFNNYDDTPTIVLNQTSENRTSQHDRISSLPDQNSYELVEFNSSDAPPSLPLLPRFKQPALDDPTGINNSTQDFVPYTTQRSQQNHYIPSSSSSSHPNRNPEQHEQSNPNHSNSSRKSSTRSTKKRKQSQQQDIIRTELIPGHRGDRDVDELVMFIDGNLSSKSRQNSAPVRPIEANSNSQSATSRRKSRKPTKTLPDHESKSSQADEDSQSIGFIDEDARTSTTTHSLAEQISLPDEDESHSNTTNGELSLPNWHSNSSIHDEIDSSSFSSTTLNNSNSEIAAEPFVTVTHRRRSIKERRQDNSNNTNSSSSFRTSRFPDKRRFAPVQNGFVRPTVSNNKPSVSTTTKEEITNSTSPPRPPASQPSSLPPASVSNHFPEQSSPRLSSHSSSSSLSSLLKRQSKAPPVVFLNKSIDVELNDVSFGFDVENAASDKAPTPPPVAPLLPPEPVEPSNEKEATSSSSPRRSYQQRNPRGPLFYSGSDIRPQQHRTYPPQSSYIDPLVLLQYNQQRYQQYAYMNLLRSQYLSSQSPYVLIPTNTAYETNPEEKDEASEQTQEPLLVYATIPGQPGPIYYQPTKKPFQSVYPPQYYYPTHPAYFQPIPSSSSMSVENKSQQDETDHDEEEDEDHALEKSTRRLEQTRQQSSSHIMSNALQLVYSQEKRNAQTDRFNLDQLTAYLAMKWTDTVDHYEQGDDEIVLTSEQ